jgi:NADPH:quinone reductase-like Zn-dependent oxidoreductase
LQGLRDKGKLQAGQKVLINGASGGMGTFAVQIAKALGAEVTAVCSTQKVETAHSLGADHVIDYTKEDVTRKTKRYDVILDVAAYRSFRDYKPILEAQGIYVMAGGDFRAFLRLTLQGSLSSKTGGQQFLVFVVKPNQRDLAFVKRCSRQTKSSP